MFSENVQTTKHVVIQEQPGMKPRKTKGGKKKPDVVSSRCCAVCDHVGYRVFCWPYANTGGLLGTNFKTL